VTPTGVRGIPSQELPSNVIVRNIGEFDEAIQHLHLPQAASQPNTDYVSQFLATFNETVAVPQDGLAREVADRRRSLLVGVDVAPAV
jgi:hypothetical protein